MIPGDDYIYKCPNCGSLLKNRSFVSGNNFGAKLFSDGKQIAPMLPDYPNLTKCKKCNSIFWLSNLEKIAKYNSWKDKNAEWGNADYADFLEIKDLCRALEITKDKKEETIIRQLIWWTINDRVRNDKQIFNDESDKDLYEQNCNILLTLLSEEDFNQRIMIAELYRNLGKFEQCLAIIKNLPTDFEWLKDEFSQQCEKKNSLVFRLY